MFRDKVIIVIFTTVTIASIVISIVNWGNPQVLSNILLIVSAASIAVICHSLNRLICENRKRKKIDVEEDF